MNRSTRGQACEERLLFLARPGAALACPYCSGLLGFDEEVFLRHWMYDEVRHGEVEGPAKRLQLQHRAVPADLAVLIAAAMPDPADQEAAGLGPPPAEPPAWPWPNDALRGRLADARAALDLVAASG